MAWAAGSAPLNGAQPAAPSQRRPTRGANQRSLRMTAGPATGPAAPPEQLPPARGSPGASVGLSRARRDGPVRGWRSAPCAPPRRLPSAPSAVRAGTPCPDGVRCTSTLRRSSGSTLRRTRSNSASRSSARVIAGFDTFRSAASPRTVCAASTDSRSGTRASWRADRSGPSRRTRVTMVCLRIPTSWSGVGGSAIDQPFRCARRLPTVLPRVEIWSAEPIWLIHRFKHRMQDISAARITDRNQLLVTRPSRARERIDQFRAAIRASIAANNARIACASPPSGRPGRA